MRSLLYGSPRGVSWTSADAEITAGDFAPEDFVTEQELPLDFDFPPPISLLPGLVWIVQFTLELNLSIDTSEARNIPWRVTDQAGTNIAAGHFAFTKANSTSGNPVDRSVALIRGSEFTPRLFLGPVLPNADLNMFAADLDVTFVGLGDVPTDAVLDVT